MTDKPLVVGIVPNLMFSIQIEDAARNAGCAITWAADWADLQAALQAGARMVIIDASTRGIAWPDWVRAVKANPQFEPVPIIAFGSHVDGALRQRALEAGVDRYLARANFIDGLHEFLDAASREVTDCPCAEPLPASIVRGLEEFNDGEYFEQHETLELVWRAELRPVRNLYRGILQIGVACLQVQHGNAAGALKLIDRGTRWLQSFRPACQGVEVDQLLADAAKMREEIKRLRPDRLSEFDPALFPVVHYQEQAQ